VFYEVPVHSPEQPARKRSRLPVLAGAFAVLAAVLVAGLVSSASAERAKTLGKTRDKARPACSKKDPEECQITGKVTGFQRSVDDKANLFKAPSNGRIVAWSVDLAKPSKRERNIFGKAAKNNEFGEAPTAGISILRKKGKTKFRLVRASPIIKLPPFYGERPTFTLRDPLRVRKGDIVALTSPTWLPAFAVKGQNQDDVWVASRPKSKCDINERDLEYYFEHSRAHKKVGSDRRYACKYIEARLLYWAYFQPGN
jgi:hypothetical protein